MYLSANVPSRAREVKEKNERYLKVTANENTRIYES